MALSEQQMGIVHHPADKHAVVLAVAGSGKSTTMVERIAYLIEAKRVDPMHLIAVMFNKAAAEEMSAKLAGRLGKRNAPESMTYHRLGTLTVNRLIKLGLAPEWDFEASPNKANYFAADVIRPTCEARGYKWPHMIAESFLGFVDRVKSDLLPPEKVFELGEWNNYPWFIEMYGIYEKARTRRKVRFFSDLIYDPVMIMRESDKAAQAIADRYAHIIVDEYQDICESQQALVRFVAGKRARVMVVGDDDQTIYTWRGAKPSYILRDFQRDFPNATVYKLNRTWRYGHALSCAANYVITGNEDRAEKLCISGDKAPDTQIELEFEKPDGKTLIGIVAKWLKEGGALGDIAILVRTYSKSAASQFALLASSVPFRLEGGDNASVLDNPWVRSLSDWLNLAAGRIAARPFAGEPDAGSVIEIKQMINVPAVGLSWEGLNALAKCILVEPNGMEGFLRFTQEHVKVSDGMLAEKIMHKGKLWKKIRSLSSEKNLKAFELLEQLVWALEVKKAIYRANKKEEDADEQWALVEAFIEYTKTHSNGGNLHDYLDHLANLRSFSERAKKSTQAIHMTSIHRSKGLEWPCVIMANLSQGAFPLKPKKHIAEDADRLIEHYEDERRLFYVGMTRARKVLHLIAPADADLHTWLRAGRTGFPSSLRMDGSSASQFLYESNLYLAKIMPLAMKKKIDLKAVSPEVFNQYLDEIGAGYAVEKIG